MKQFLIAWPVFFFTAFHPSFGQFIPSPRSASQTTQGTAWSGTSGIRNHWMRIGIEAGYLDVVEEVEIQSLGFSWNWLPLGDRSTLEITGSFHLPTGSAITGILIWDGETVLKGKLKPTETANREYEDVVDRNTSTPVTPRDPFFVRQTGTNSVYESYEYKIYPVVWGQFRKVRLRYLLPRKPEALGNGYFFPTPVFWSANNANTFQCSLESRLGISSVKYLKNGKDTASEVPGTINMPYSLSTRTEFRTIPQIPAQWLVTSMVEGDLQGHYLHFRSSLPKEVLEKSGLVREVVFLWKWNHPETFYESSEDALISTTWGAEVKQQANRIQQVADMTLQHEGEVGLVMHVGDRHRPNLFPMGPKSSPEAERIREVLTAVATDNYWPELSKQLGRPNDPELNQPTTAQNGVIGFHLAIRAAFSLFTPESNRIRTILFLTVGPRYPGDAPITDSLDLEFLGNVSLAALPFSTNRLEWPGINLDAAVKDPSRSFRQTDPGTGLPLLGAQSVKLEFRTGARTFQVDAPAQNLGRTAYPWNLVFAGHAMEPWSPEVNIELRGTDGRVTRMSHRFVPRPSPNDTNLAKLWAKAPNRVSDRFPQTDLGLVFGVVDGSSALLALETDIAPASSAGEILAGGVPHLHPDEIFAPLVPQSIHGAGRNRSGIAYSVRNGKLELRFPAFRRGQIKILSLSGKLLWTEPLRPGSVMLALPLPPDAAHSTFILVLELDQKIHRFLLPAGARP